MKYKRFFTNRSDLESGILQGEEFNHAINVMRLRVNDIISLFCGDDFDYIARITSITKKNVRFKMVETLKNEANPKLDITLIQALAKGDKLEFIAQKSTEIGSTTLIPFHSEFCDVKPNTSRVERLEKISIGACKQCGRSKPLIVKPISSLFVIDFSVYDSVILANESETSRRLGQLNLEGKNIAVIVGPEGGFGQAELEMLKSKGAISTTLGKRVLRTETAGIYILSYLAERLEV